MAFQHYKHLDAMNKKYASPSCTKIGTDVRINFVNYVRDPKEAQLHILITEQFTESGGEEYSLFLDFESLKA